ncbi:helix-turn-helix transcriptional regulator [Streptomyces sp. NPDC102340]|uniref:helix-turn-helix transcriptional regulator n=1 Tax=unclassified Streptomyces TaxID=2593676 RepID=UPI0037FC6B12
MDGPKGRAADGHLAHLRRLRAAKDVMDRDWADETLDLDAVAARAGYSRSHFVRVFKTAYGRTPGQYLSQRRIERAAEMLRTCDLSITEICHLVGFTGLGTFTTRFKQHMDQTPGEYRRSKIARGAALIPGCYALLWAGGFHPTRDSGTRDSATSDSKTKDSNSEEAD